MKIAWTSRLPHIRESYRDVSSNLCHGATVAAQQKMDSCKTLKMILNYQLILQFIIT